MPRCTASCSSMIRRRRCSARHYLVTLGAVRALHDLQLAERIALIGFDDIVLADLVRPAISVMAHDPTQLGTLAAERIFARLDGDTQLFKPSSSPRS